MALTCQSSPLSLHSCSLSGFHFLKPLQSLHELVPYPETLLALLHPLLPRFYSNLRPGPSVTSPEEPLWVMGFHLYILICLGNKYYYDIIRRKHLNYIHFKVKSNVETTDTQGVPRRGRSVGWKARDVFQGR